MIAYKYRSGRGTRDDNGNDVFERDIELLSKDTIYVPTVKQLNDPAEAFVDDSLFRALLQKWKARGVGDALKQVEISYKQLRDRIQTSGIYSLSKKIDNELMWAYYASGHSGYAIIFDTEILSRSFDYGEWGGMYEFDVRYSRKLPCFDLTKINRYSTIKVLSCFLGNKSRAWAHEDEHRLVFDKGGACLEIDYRAIKGFVFGCRMNEASIDYVMHTLSGRGLNYYRVKLKDDSYRLFLEPLADKYPNAEKYCPNKAKYNLFELLELDKFIQGAGYKYESFVEEALKEVCLEPFVTEVYSILVSDNQKFPHILIWAYIKQEGNFRPARKFEYDIVEGRLVRSFGR